MVGIIMGSDSDFYVMDEVAHVFKDLEIEFDMEIVSAHRTPDKMFMYAKTVKDRDISVIVAGAGGSAHLPGMVASLTSIPVIGVPIKTKSMDGLDSLLSIVQMPTGVPVATVPVNGGTAAGLLAARILGVGNSSLQLKLAEYMKLIINNNSIKTWLTDQYRTVNENFDEVKT